jgi:PKD repeat protein
MSIYSKNEFYPKEPVIVSGKTKLRGIDVVMLGITPFQYNPVTKELIVYQDLKVEITFNGGNGQIGEDRLRSKWWDPIVNDAVLNSSIIPEKDYSYIPSDSKTPDYEYIIITVDDPDFLSWADTIKNWRNQQGISTGIVTTTELSGNTVANIKNYISNAYDTWDVPPVAVLLLGDYATDNTGIISILYDHPSGYPDYASDNYYADMNGNNLPDLVVARITGNDNTQLETMITKFIGYETDPPVDADFYDHPITALGWQTERWFQICSETVGGYFKNKQSKNPVRINALYSGNPSSDPWSTATNTATVVNYFGPNGLGYIPATPQELGGFTGGTSTDVTNAINGGSFLLQHRDHGGYTGWGEPYYRLANIDDLTNVNNELPFIFSINCQTGAFHRSTECFTEKFHRYKFNNQNSGALGVIAASEVSYSFVNDTYVWGLYDNMFPDFMPAYGTQFPTTYVRPAFGNAAAKHFLYQSSWPYNSSSKLVTYRLFHHHGDAFMALYTEVPENLVVNHAQELMNTQTSFNVSADAGSFIALTVNNEIIGTADGTGNPVAITIPTQTAGNKMKVTITKQNYFRYSSDVIIVADGILAEFSADNTSVCSGEAVTYTDESVGSPTSWEWTFIGGTPGTHSGQNPPAITYSTAGAYDVTLIISDGTDEDTLTKTAYINVQSLTADFSGSPTTVTIGSSVTFTDNSLCDPTSWNWTFEGGTPSSSAEQNPTVTYNTAGTYDVSLAVSNASGNDTKTLTNYVTVNDIQYCASHGNASIEWVASVNFGGQTNTSGSSGSAGYEDFTTFDFIMDAGSSNSIVLSPGFAGRSSHQYWKVWIDYNHDGDFTDANEEVFAPSKSKSAVSGSINIPSGLNVTTIMRVSMKSGGYATPCDIFSRGEVEDYTIVISVPIPQPPIANFTSDRTIIGIGETVQFIDQSSDNPTSWSWTFAGGTPASSTAQNPSVSYSALGTYDVSLTATNAQGSDTKTVVGYIVVSENPPPAYCVPIAIDNSGDYINTLTIAGVTNNSGQGSSGYTHYTSPSFVMTPGQSYSVSLSPYDAKNRNFWRIWVDINGDGDFTDTGETLFIANNKKGTISGSITLPSNTTIPTRMRVTMKTGGSPASCDDNFSGEVEDYDVTSGDGDLFIRPDFNKLNVGVYPNPANNLLNINISGNYAKVSVYIYNAVGNLMQSFMMNDQNEQIKLDHYSQGMYFIHVYDGRERSLQKFIKR